MPSAAAARRTGAVSYTHLDVYKRQFEFRPVGYGCQDVPAIVAAGLEAGAFCFVVEQDQWYDRTPMEAAKMSIETLRKAGL